jgi:predicted transcriptional regulator
MRVRQPLTDLENEVMQAVWDGGTCTVEAVHRIVSRKRNLKERQFARCYGDLSKKVTSGTSRTVERTRIGR